MISTHFLFPTHPLKSTEIEEMFADQAEALRGAGFTTSLCPDSVIEAGRPLRNIPSGATVVYRGWMLNARNYSALESAIVKAGAAILTSTEKYLATHHLPNWYPLIQEFTPETRILPLGVDLERELHALGWNSFFIKDYVKSLKTSRGSIVNEPSEIGAVVAEMEHFRGEIEGGICVRRVEPFIHDTERRYFVLNGKPFSATDDSIPAIVEEVARRIPSSFFSIDVIQREDGALRIVEVGDGQVSDLVGWTTSRFAAMWSGFIQ